MSRSMTRSVTHVDVYSGAPRAGRASRVAQVSFASALPMAARPWVMSSSLTAYDSRR